MTDPNGPRRDPGIGPQDRPALNYGRLIRCRARTTPDCLHSTFDHPENPWQDDGTYDRPTNTIVCDACYTALLPYTPSRRGLFHELPDAIATVRRLRLEDSNARP